MTRLYVVVLVIEDLPLNINNIMRHAKKCLSPITLGVRRCIDLPLGRF